MKKEMDACTLKYISRKKLAVTLCAIWLALTSFSNQPPMGQEPAQVETVLYYYHYSGQDDCPDLLPEDSYMELYFENGRLRKGYFWGTSDEFDRVREGYKCGYFVLPMTQIKQTTDSISFVLDARRKDKKRFNCFFMAPVDWRIRTWQEAKEFYQPWDNYSYTDSVCYSMRVTKDSVILRNLPEPYYSGDRTFIRREKTSWTW